MCAAHQTNCRPYLFIPAARGTPGGVYIYRDDDLSLYYELGRSEEMVSVQHRPYHEDLWQGAASDAGGHISGYVSVMRSQSFIVHYDGCYNSNWGIGCARLRVFC